MRVERESARAEGSHAHLARTSSATPPVADEGMQSATHTTVDRRITADIRHVTLPISCPAMARDARHEQNAEVWARGPAPHGECDPAALEAKRGRIAKMAVKATPLNFGFVLE
jgi:hypothetical protein